MKFKFFSEKASCTTPSLRDAYRDEPIRVKPYLDKNNYLIVEYTLLSPILDNYDFKQLVMNRTSFGLTMDSHIFQTRNITISKGEIIYGPLEDNCGYSFNLKSCDVKYNDCISSMPVYYSLSKTSPKNISDLDFDLIGSRFIVLKWKQPLIPNDFFLSYKLYRRPACNESLQVAKTESDVQKLTVDCNGMIYDKLDGSECCGKVYHNPQKNNEKCCGGKIHAALTGYQCCGNIYYIHVPLGQICCSYKSNDFGSQIGYGNMCCGSQPYYNFSRVQKCCGKKVVPKELLIPGHEYYSNICTARQKEIATEICSSFNKINSSGNLFFNDTGLNPDESYEYRLCVNNSFATECNEKKFIIRTFKSLPEDFKYFSYRMFDDRIVFIWNKPVHSNGEIERYKVMRDNNEVYNGLNLFYVEKKDILEEYHAYKYEVILINYLYQKNIPKYRILISFARGNI